MDEDAKPRIRVDSYLSWIKKEGVAVVEDYGIDLFSVQTQPWARYGMKGAACHCKGRGDFGSMFLFEIAPGGSSAPLRHLYEEVIYVLEGTGSTQLEFADGTKRSFEWGPRSMFAIPLNAKHRHFNGSGQQYYRHSDWLGSSRFSSSGAGAVVYDRAYAPFGEIYAELNGVNLKAKMNIFSCIKTITQVIDQFRKIYGHINRFHVFRLIEFFMDQ